MKDLWLRILLCERRLGPGRYPDHEYRDKNKKHYLYLNILCYRVEQYYPKFVALLAGWREVDL